MIDQTGTDDFGGAPAPPPDPAELVREGVEGDLDIAIARALLLLIESSGDVTTKPALLRARRFRPTGGRNVLSLLPKKALFGLIERCEAKGLVLRLGTDYRLTPEGRRYVRGFLPVPVGLSEVL